VIPDIQNLDYSGRKEAVFYTSEFVFAARKVVKPHKQELVYTDSCDVILNNE
jgi:hypothetical protein